MMKPYPAGSYDIAVIGAGHAGIEAALAAARLGCRTVIFTILMPSAICPVIPASAAPPRGIWFGN